MSAPWMPEASIAVSSANELSNATDMSWLGWVQCSFAETVKAQIWAQTESNKNLCWKDQNE